MIVEVLLINLITLLVRGVSNASIMILILPIFFFESPMRQALILIPCFSCSFLEKHLGNST